MNDAWMERYCGEPKRSTRDNTSHGHEMFAHIHKTKRLCDEPPVDPVH